VISLEIPILNNVYSLKASNSTTIEMQIKFASLFIYTAIFMASQVFQIVLSIESVFFKNTIQIFGVIAFNIMAFFYSITQYFQIQKGYAAEAVDSTYQIQELYLKIGIIAIIIGVGQIFLMIFGFGLYREFGWKIYRRLGSDLTMRKCFMTYHILTMFLKFDIFFLLGFLVQFLNFTIRSNDIELSLTIAFIPIGLTIIALTVFAVQTENKWVAYISCAGFIGGIPYFVFKIFRILTWEKYKNYMYFLLMFAFLSLMGILISLALLIMCIRNFDKGLTPHIQILMKPRSSTRRVSTLNLEGE